MNKILVVDDEIEICNFLSEFLTKKGYDVSVAASGQEAVSLVGSINPEIVLMDIRMPGMDGIEALRKIKQMRDNIEVVMITAVNDEEIAKEAMSVGASDYITKPLSLSYLETVVMVKLFMNDKTT